MHNPTPEPRRPFLTLTLNAMENMTIAYFTSPTCAPCKSFGPTLTEFAKEKGIELLKFVSTNDDHVSTFQLYEVRSVPTIVLHDFELNEIKRNIGPLTVVELEAFINVD